MVRIKQLGPHRPKNIHITQPSKEKQKSYIRSFTRTWFDKKAWLTVCRSNNALFCFPCLLFKSSSDSAWTETGITDLKHLSERLKKHERSMIHMNNCVKLAMVGRMSIATQLDEGHRIGVRRRNEEVDKNRHIFTTPTTTPPLSSVHSCIVYSSLQTYGGIMPSVCILYIVLCKPMVASCLQCAYCM